MSTLFVAGATGYTGRSVVASCLRRGLTTVAHVRPDSSRLDHWRETFEAQGAVVDTSPWTHEGMAEAMGRHRPDVVFSLLGTTAKRAKAEDASYEAVDYGLSVLLLQAAGSIEPAPCFVYLSAVGAGGKPSNPYMKARVRVEAAIAEAGIEHVIARPAFVTGPDREDDRPGERIGASMLDGALGVLAAVGMRGLQDRWASLRGKDLAEALVELATSARRGVFEAADLRAASGQGM